MARLIDDQGLIAIGVDRSVWLDARGEDVPGPGSVPSSGHGFMVRSFDQLNHSRQYGQSRTEVSVSEPFVRRPRGRVSEPSPWSWSSCTVLPGRTVGRAHQPNSRSVHLHSAATRGSPHITVPSPSHIPLACRAHQSECGRTPPARGRRKGGPASMTPFETGSTITPGNSRATAPPPRTFGPQGPTLGDLSDAYLQDYQVRQFRSVSTARGRTAHLAAFFGRNALAATVTTYQIRQYQRARRAAGAATGTINRETSALHRMGTLAVHWGWLDTVPGFPDRLREHSPRQGFFEHPEYLAVRAYLPGPWQDILNVATTPAGARMRSSASPGTKLTRPAVSSDSRRRVQRRWWGGYSRSHTPLPRPWRDGGPAATQTARWSSTATAFPSAAGARRGAPPVRRLGCRPASSTIVAAPPPAT